MRQSRVLAGMVEERQDLLVLEVDMSEASNAAAFAWVTSVPRLEVYREGERAWQGRGLTPADRLEELIGAAAR